MNLGRLTFFQRVEMYAQAIGDVAEVAAAFDLAALPLGDAQHRDLAARLAGAYGEHLAPPVVPVEASYDPTGQPPLDAGDDAGLDDGDISLTEALAPLEDEFSDVLGDDEDAVSLDELMAVTGDVDMPFDDVADVPAAAVEAEPGVPEEAA